MSLTTIERQEITDQLAALNMRKDHYARFFELAERLGLDSPEGAGRLAKSYKNSNKRLLLSLPETIEANVNGAVALTGIDRETFIDLGLKAPGIFSFPPQTTLTHINAFRDLLKLKDSKDVVNVILLHPAILHSAPERLRRRADSLIEKLEISPTDLRKMAKRSPQILALEPASLLAHADGLATCLEIGRKDIIKAAIKEPSLLTRDPKTIDAHITAAAEALDVPKADYVAAALTRPSLMSLSKERVLGNVEATSELLGLSKAEFVSLAMKQPPLFTLKSTTVDANVTASCHQLGVTRAQFLTAAKKMPPLLTMDPQTLDRHATMLQRQYRAAGQEKTKAELLIERPSNLCRSDEALLGRFLVQQHGLVDAAPSVIIRKPNTVIQKAVREHYEGRLAGAETPKQEAQVARTLQQLHRLKVIGALPEGIEPMAPRSR